MEFGKNPLTEREKQHRAVENVTQEALAQIAVNSHALSLDLHELKEPDDVESVDSARHYMKISAREHVAMVSRFYNEQYPDGEALAIRDGVYSVLPLHDVMTNEVMMLVASSMLTNDNRTMKVVQIAVHETDLVTVNTLVSEDGGEFRATSTLRARSDKLLLDMLSRIDAGQRETVVQLITGHPPEQEARELMAETRRIIASRYDDAETDRYMQVLEQHYLQRHQAISMEKQVEMPEMTSNELEALHATLTAPDKWT